MARNKLSKQLERIARETGLLHEPKRDTSTQDSKSATLTLPPSTNGLFLSAGRRRVKTPEYRDWITENTWKVAAMEKPTAFPVHVRIKVCGKVNARRDLDNLIKPTLDLLVSAGVLPDDNVKHVTGGRWEYDPIESEPHVVVWLEEAS